MDTIVFNPLDPAYRANPYPVLNRLREEEPHYRWALADTLVLSRYEEVVAVLRHPAVTSDPVKAADASGQPIEFGPDQRGSFLIMDPPDHTRLRGLVQKAFTPRTVEQLRPRVEAIVDGVIARVAGTGHMEVVADLAYPLPVTIISEMMGVPAEDHDRFQAWSQVLARSLDADFLLPPEAIAQRDAAGEEFRDYFTGLIERRRAEPREDLLSALMAAEESGDKLTTDELLSTLILLLVAGHETTVNLIGNGVLQLLRHPDQLARLRADPELAKPCVDEVLRFDPPVQFDGRTALKDIELPTGFVVKRGESPVLLLGAANRDPAVFAEPERFDIGRSDNRHLSFGFGIHHCLGAPLARLETQVALSAVATRLDGLRLDEDPPGYKENVVLRGVTALPVSFAATQSRP